MGRFPKPSPVSATPKAGKYDPRFGITARKVKNADSAGIIDWDTEPLAATKWKPGMECAKSASPQPLGTDNDKVVIGYSKIAVDMLQQKEQTPTFSQARSQSPGP